MEKPKTHEEKLEEAKTKHGRDFIAHRADLYKRTQPKSDRLRKLERSHQKP